MSSSAWGKLIVGWWFKDEPLQVTKGKHFQCYYPSHELNGSRAHCPVCGMRVDEVDTMVPSPLVERFAQKRGISVPETFEILKPYQHELPKCWDTDSGGWVLGVVVSEVRSNQWNQIRTGMPPEDRQLLLEAGMLEGVEEQYLAVWLS